tara:strand:- start:1836 stop:2093 length:258 start_codon:yes stop_codon:yes gene_type:complete
MLNITISLLGMFLIWFFLIYPLNCIVKENNEYITNLRDIVKEKELEVREKEINYIINLEKKILRFPRDRFLKVELKRKQRKLKNK